MVTVISCGFAISLHSAGATLETDQLSQAAYLVVNLGGETFRHQILKLSVKSVQIHFCLIGLCTRHKYQNKFTKQNSRDNPSLALRM